MNVSRLVKLAFLACICAGVALAQNAGDKTGGPTRNDYRLRVIQPAEGSTITGDRLQVIVDTEIPSERDTRQDVNSMPRPDIDVFLDGMFRETMRDEKNVVDVYNIQPGPHTLVLLALNRTREIIDRKEIHVEVVAPPVAQAPRPAEHPVRVAPPPAPAPAPAPASVPPAPVAAPLPKTGTSDPLLAAAGLALVVGGLALKRFA